MLHRNLNSQCWRSPQACWVLIINYNYNIPYITTVSVVSSLSCLTMAHSMHIWVPWPSLKLILFCQDAPGLNCSSDACSFSTGRVPRRMRYTDLTWSLLQSSRLSSSPTKTRRTRHKKRVRNVRTTENRSWKPPWKSPSEMSWPARCAETIKFKTQSAWRRGSRRSFGAQLLWSCWGQYYKDRSNWQPGAPSGRTKPLDHG